MMRLGHLMSIGELANGGKGRGRGELIVNSCVSWESVRGASTIEHSVVREVTGGIRNVVFLTKIKIVKRITQRCGKRKNKTGEDNRVKKNKLEL